jgi:hypothetical protein
MQEALPGEIRRATGNGSSRVATVKQLTTRNAFPGQEVPANDSLIAINVSTLGRPSAAALTGR